MIRKAKKTMANEGIKEGLSTIKYQVKAIFKEHLFTKIIVAYNKSHFFLKPELNNTSSTPRPVWIVFIEKIK